MKKLLGMSLRIALVALLTAVAAYFIPTPYILRAPGHADDLSRIVSVEGGRAETPGQLYMTTVIYEKANILFCLYSMFDRHAMLVPAEDTPYRRVAVPTPSGPHPPLGTSEDMMELSKEVAKIVALRKLGYEIKIESTGARVIGFLDKVPASAELRLGDVIDGVDGGPVRTVAQLRKALAHRAAGDRVTVQYRREGKAGEAKFALVAHLGKAIIGIMTQDAVERVKLPREITIATHNINGASAGLMFTLEIIDQLTPGGITRGHKIAGTGTIELNGAVGAVEGTELKVVAAQRAGATVFLVPEENYREVKDAVPEMRIVPVRTLDDALKAIKSLP